ncbi:unnamed protein product [Ectocarpus fasciculatus]
MDNIQEGANYAHKSEEDASEEDESETNSDDSSYDYGLAADDSDEEEEGDGYEVDYASLNVSPELLRMLGASERVIAAKEAQVSAVVSMWEAPPESGLENSVSIADSAAVALGSSGAAHGSGVARVFKPVGGFDTDAVAAAATAEEAPVWKVKIVHSPEPVPRGRASKLLPVPEDSSLSDDNGDEEGESWDEASAFEGHAWWESDSEDEDYEMLSAMSPNLQAVMGLRKTTGTDTTNAEQGDKKNDWHPPSFAGLNNSRRVTVLRPLVVGHGKDLDVEYRNGRRQEEEEGDCGDEDDDDSSEEEGWDYQDISKDDYDSYVRKWSTNVSPNLARAMGCHSSVEQKAKALSKGLTWEAPASFGLRNSGDIKDVGRTNSVLINDTAGASRPAYSCSLKRSLTTGEKARSKDSSCETSASLGLRDTCSSGTIKGVGRTNRVDPSRPASSLKRSLVLRWRKAVDASCFGIGEYEQSL